MSLNFVAAILLYNECAEKNEIVKSISNQPFWKIVVLDNGDASYIRMNEEWASNTAAKDSRVTYVSMNGNAGIPPAYNKAIHLASGGDAICFFDDDTELSKDYLIKMQRIFLENGEPDIVCPVVRACDVIISPCNRTKFSFRPIKDVSELTSKYSAINSGICVSMRYASGHKFSTNYFLDFVDHDYIRTAWECGAKITVAKDVLLTQHLSLYSKESRQVQLGRLRTFSKDCNSFYSRSSLERLFSKAVIVKRFCKAMFARAQIK